MPQGRTNMRGARTVIVFVVENLENKIEGHFHKTGRNPQRFPRTSHQILALLESNQLANKTLHFRKVGLTL